jgi:pimeloyl-ACP methyl ester carboxylesterase
MTKTQDASAVIAEPSLETAAGDGEVVRFTAQDGITLAARVFGIHQPDRLPILALPGLARNSKDFIRLGQFFSEENQPPRQVVALDYRGRGFSDPDPDWTRYSPLVEARDVLTASEAMGVHKAAVVGTSRGGIIAMILGALRPGLMAGIVLNDVGPVIEGTGLARIKGYLTNASMPKDFGEAVERLKKTMGGHFTAAGKDDWRAMAEAIYVQGENGLRLDVDPGLIKSVNSIDLENAIPTLWPQFDSIRNHPVLSIRGENSDILSEQTVKLMMKHHGNLETLTVAGQGHAPLLRDEPTLNRIAAFALRCDVVRH